MSKAIKILGTKIIKAIHKGNIPVQQKVINWSNLKRGSVALNHTNKKQNMQALIPNIIDWKFITLLFINSSGHEKPPKNKIGVILLNNTILLYSAKKKKTKIIEECSTKKPATNSDSLN